VVVIVVSSLLVIGEFDEVRVFAVGLGVCYFMLSIDEMVCEGYRVNVGDCCFFCKVELFDVFGLLVDEFGVVAIVMGTNVDDVLVGFCFGIWVVVECGVLMLLCDSGFIKV